MAHKQTWPEIESAEDMIAFLETDVTNIRRLNADQSSISANGVTMVCPSIREGLSVLLRAKRIREQEPTR